MARPGKGPPQAGEAPPRGFCPGRWERYDAGLCGQRGGIGGYSLSAAGFLDLFQGEEFALFAKVCNLAPAFQDGSRELLIEQEFHGFPLGRSQRADQAQYLSERRSLPAGKTSGGGHDATITQNAGGGSKNWVVVLQLRAKLEALFVELVEK